MKERSAGKTIRDIVMSKEVIFSLLVAFIYFFNFFHQSRYGAIECDTQIHLSYVRYLFETGHLPAVKQSYPLFFYVIALFVVIFRNYTIATLLFLVIWAFAANLIQIRFIRSFVNTGTEWYAVLAGSALSFVWPVTSAILSLFMDPSEFNANMQLVYLTSGATAPFHSLTYLCVKPFALLSVYFFYRMISEDDPEVKHVVGLAVAMLLSVLAKPCFYQAFAPAGFIFTVICFLMKRYKFGKCFTIGLGFVPATAWVIYTMLSDINEAYPMAFMPFSGMNYYNDGVPAVIIIVRTLAYALFVIAVSVIMKKWSGEMTVAVLIYMCGAMEWFFINFTTSPGTLDMLWGYSISVYILFTVSAAHFKNLLNTKNNKIVMIAGNTMLALHSITGILVYVVFWASSWIGWLGLS